MRAALVLLAVVACGYAPVRGPSAKRWSVAAPRNDTAQAEVGGWLAQELRSELSTRGELDSSGPEILPEILSLRSFTSAAGAEGAAAFRVEAQVALRGAANDAVTGSEDYLAGVDVEGTEANRRAAIRRLFRSVSRELVERLEVAERLR